MYIIEKIWFKIINRYYILARTDARTHTRTSIIYIYIYIYIYIIKNYMGSQKLFVFYHSSCIYIYIYIQDLYELEAKHSHNTPSNIKNP